MTRPTLHLYACSLLLACQPRDVDVSDPADKGGACNPDFADQEDPEGNPCLEGLRCEQVVDSDVFVCGAPVRIHGQVIDIATSAPIAGALVNGLDRTGAPLGEIAITDAAGHYELEVSAPRDMAGEIAADAQYTLQSFAVDYTPFPSGIRIALPISAADGKYDDELAATVIDNPSTIVGLLQLPADQRGGVTISGHVLGDDPGGTFVVAEGPKNAPYGVADATGAYTLFNVKPGPVDLHGYRRGLEVVPRKLDVAAAPLTDIDLEVSAEGNDALAAVSGSVNIVNAPGGSLTSVVLVPVSVFNTNLERGPIPFGLRAPDPGKTPDIDNTFTIPGVPAGKYKVLAAFENDLLVRDPDLSIGGTALQEITVAAGKDTTLDASFKITAALAVVSPGKEVPERVKGNPTFVFADDSSEDRYVVRVFDVFGTMIWENPMVPAVKGGMNVEVPYQGPKLTPGGYYQFRAISVKKDVAISATEDLRGVFIAG